MCLRWNEAKACLGSNSFPNSLATKNFLIWQLADPWHLFFFFFTEGCISHMMEHQHQEKVTSNPSSCLTCWGAKSHFAANLGRLLQKAKDLFSYAGGCIILQQIQKASCKNLRTHSHIPRAVSFYKKYEKPSSKKLETHPVISYDGGLRPIGQQI